MDERTDMQWIVVRCETIHNRLFCTRLITNDFIRALPFVLWNNGGCRLLRVGYGLRKSTPCNFRTDMECGTLFV